jgi:hypothetical protein
MSTYADLQQRIAEDYLNRSDFTNQVKRAILSAIRYYERQRWRFNETATAIATIAGQSYLALPANFLVLDALQISAYGTLSPLLPTNLDGLLTLRFTVDTGVPTHFYMRQNRIEIAVVPDSAYSCPLYYLKTLPELSADTDSNSWTSNLHQDLIVYHATKLLWSNTLRNPNEASRYAQLEQLTMSQLSLEQLQFDHLGLTPTQF